MIKKMGRVIKMDKLAILGQRCKTDMEVLDFAADYLYENGYVHESFREALKERERTYPTGLPTTPYGVAIPHTFPEHVKKEAVLTITLEKPVPFREMGAITDSFVDICCLFVLLLVEEQKQINMLPKLMKLIQDADTIAAIVQSQSQDEVSKLISGYLNIS